MLTMLPMRNQPIRHRYTLALTLGLTLTGIVCAFNQYFLLRGTIIALMLTVFMQVYVPGWVFARVLGVLDGQHPILRFVWITWCGLMFAIGLSMVARYVGLAVPIIVLITGAATVGLLARLLVGTFRVSRDAGLTVPRWYFIPERSWSFWLIRWLLYGLLALCCCLALWAGYVRTRFRPASDIDQTIFVSLANWLANSPDDPTLRDRFIDPVSNDIRWSFDGWTYTHAVWSWSSGVPADQLIWYELTPLFVWLIPLIFFALSYTLTGSTAVAVWSAAALTLFGLQTFDGFFYSTQYLSYGQNAFFDLTILKNTATAIMLPLSLFATLWVMQHWRRRLLIVPLLSLFVLGGMHVRQAMIYSAVIGLTGGLGILARLLRSSFQRGRRLFSRRNATRLLVGGGLIALLLILPLTLIWQRLTTSYTPVSAVTQTITCASITSQDRVPIAAIGTKSYGDVDIRILRDLPFGIGTIYFLDPAYLGYTPLLSGSVLIGLVIVVMQRRAIFMPQQLALRYIVACLALALSIPLVPAIAGVFARWSGVALTLGDVCNLRNLIFSGAIGNLVGISVYAVPVGFIVAYALQKLAHLFMRWPRRQRLVTLLITLGLAAVLIAVMVEPFPIPASARRQMIAIEQALQAVDIRPTQAQLVTDLAAILSARPVSASRRVRVMAPSDLDGYIVESVPFTLVASTDRLATPWIDGLGLKYLADRQIDYIVLTADDLRLPQLLYWSAHFERVASSTIYRIFRVLPIDSVATIDPAARLFQQMNVLYASVSIPRWQPDEQFQLVRRAKLQPWQALIAAWQVQQRQTPADALVQYGLAWTYLLADQDRQALPLWKTLAANSEAPPICSAALAFTLHALGQVEQGRDVLLAIVDAGAPLESQLLAARSLLTTTFFYSLSTIKAQKLVRLTASSLEAAQIWSGIGQPLDQRAMLASSVGEWRIAAQWLNQIPQLALSADIVYAQGLFALAQGDPNAALAVWKPATDEAWLARLRFQHPERWQLNTAAQAYYLLRGDLAMERRAWREAQTFYLQAIQAGANTVGAYFLAAAYRADDQQDQAARQSATLPLSLPLLKPLLTVAQSGAVYLTAPEVVHGADERTLNVSVFVQTLHDLPLRPDTLTVKIIQPDSNVQYGSTQILLAEGTDDELLTAAFRQVNIPVMLDTSPSPLTAAVVIIEATSQTEIVLARQIVPIVLARPDAVSIPPTATLSNFRFGTDITLQAYRAQTDARSLTLDLYWRTSTTPTHDYQIFVHVLDATGKLVAQLDSVPVDGRYPTRQWRAETTIEEQRKITFATPLEAGTYTVTVGMYRLADLKRLPVTVDSVLAQVNAKTEDTAILLRFTP